MGGKSSKSPKTPSKKRNDDAITEQDRAILDLKNSRDRLQKYKKRLETDDLALLATVRKHLAASNKPSALLIMKLRKHKQLEMTRVENQMFTVYEMVSTIVWETEQIKVISAMKEGKSALERMHSEMSADDVIELMDDIQDLQEVEKRINEAFTDGFGLEEGDEEELEVELTKMEKEIKVESGVGVVAEGAGEEVEMPEAPKSSILDLPEVPMEELRVEEEAEKEEKEDIKRAAIAS